MMTIGDHPDLLALGYLLNQNMLRPSDRVTGIDYDEEVEVEEVTATPENEPEVISLEDADAEEAGEDNGEEIPDIEDAEDVEDIGEDDADTFLEEDEEEEGDLDFDVGGGDER